MDWNYSKCSLKSSSQWKEDCMPYLQSGTWTHILSPLRGFLASAEGWPGGITAVGCSTPSVTKGKAPGQHYAVTSDPVCHGIFFSAETLLLGLAWATALSVQQPSLCQPWLPLGNEPTDCPPSLVSALPHHYGASWLVPVMVNISESAPASRFTFPAWLQTCPSQFWGACPAPVQEQSEIRDAENRWPRCQLPGSRDTVQSWNQLPLSSFHTTS